MNETNFFYTENYNESIESISTHFSELFLNVEKGQRKKEEEIEKLDIDTLFDILKHPKLQLKNEDELLKFINDMYSKDSKYSILYETVLFSNVEKSTICEFVDIFDINDLNIQIWQNLSARLRCEVINENEEEKLKEKRYKENSHPGRLFKSNDDDKFDGIINYLKKETNNKINITASSVNTPYYPSNVIEYDDRNKWFHSQRQSNNWICFDFNENSVIPTNYKIRSSEYSANSHNPRSWNIEGSNDNNEWEVLSEEKDSQYLNGSHLVHLFSINKKQNKKYRYIRMRLTDKNWCNSDYFMLDSFELYGNLICTTK